MNVGISQNRFSANQIPSFVFPSFVIPRKTFSVLSFSVSCVNQELLPETVIINWCHTCPIIHRFLLQLVHKCISRHYLVNRISTISTSLFGQWNKQQNLVEPLGYYSCNYLLIESKSYELVRRYTSFDHRSSFPRYTCRRFRTCRWLSLYVFIQPHINFTYYGILAT